MSTRSDEETTSVRPASFGKRNRTLASHRGYRRERISNRPASPLASQGASVADDLLNRVRRDQPRAVFVLRVQCIVLVNGTSVSTTSDRRGRRLIVDSLLFL